ncbi:hypothetical protein KKG31_04995 [Patescibacteria group bacterium]|nr:hypothetical protein [Patescibacteria group bacterium]MBU1758480.1 hypothetical protein [Patescibacteria group bacterium]
MPKRTTKNRSIEVIVLQADKHLGEKFEIIRVKPVYARNILLAQGIVVLADTNNKNKYAQKMKAAEEDRKKKATGLEDLFMKIQNDGGITLVKKANKEHNLYAKVDENEISKHIKEIYGIDVDAHYFKLKKKLTKLGQFVVPFMYKELKKEIVVKIELDPEEAKKHAKAAEKKMTVEEVEDNTPKKSKEELKAEKEAERAKKKVETLKKLKEKYK